MQGSSLPRAEVSRRRWTATALAMLAGSARSQASSDAPAGPSAAPSVWRGLSQAQLDGSFDMPKAAPNMRQVTHRWAANSDRARAVLGAPMRIAYGPAPVEQLDWYPTGRPDAPVHIFLHGGAFDLEEASHFGFLGEAFVRAGAHFVVPDFSSAKDVGADVRVLVAQVRRAVAWVSRNATRYSGRADRIFLSGHSSGAELASQVMVTDWARAFGLPAETVQGALLCSGIYDFGALRLARAGAAFRLDENIEAELSFAAQADHLKAPLVVALGSLDTLAFQIGSRDLVSQLTAKGKRASLLVAEGYNHFEVIETLANPYGPLGRAMLQLMGLAATGAGSPAG